MNISKIGQQGQIAIPRVILQQLNLQQGDLGVGHLSAPPARSVVTDRLAFIHRDNEVVLQPLKTTLSNFRGSVPVSAPQDFDMIRQQVINRGAYRTMTNDE